MSRHGETLVFQLCRDKFHQQAFAAGMSVGRVAKVKAGKRVLEHKRTTPRRMWRTAIASIFQEFQFELKKIQQVPLVFRHKAPRSIRIAGRPFGCDGVAHM